MNASAADVLVTIRFFDETAVARLQARGHRVIRADISYDALDTAITPGIERALETAQAWILGTAPVTRALLERYPRLKVIARRGVGYDSIDVVAVKDLGRLLTNTPGGNEPAVADHAVGLMLAVGKRLAESHARMQAGDWRAIVGADLQGKTVGLVGLGRIGRMVARRLHGFDATPALDRRGVVAIPDRRVVFRHHSRTTSECLVHPFRLPAAQPGPGAQPERAGRVDTGGRDRCAVAGGSLFRAIAPQRACPDTGDTGVAGRPILCRLQARRRASPGCEVSGDRTRNLQLLCPGRNSTAS